jgi:hypothetical protein
VQIQFPEAAKGTRLGSLYCFVMIMGRLAKFAEKRRIVEECTEQKDRGNAKLRNWDPGAFCRETWGSASEMLNRGWAPCSSGGGDWPTLRST